MLSGLAIGKPKIQKKVFCFFDHTTTNTHNLVTFRFLPVVETIFIDHTSTTEKRLQKPAYDASQGSCCFTLADKNSYAILQKLLSNVG